MGMQKTATGLLATIGLLVKVYSSSCLLHCVVVTQTLLGLSYISMNQPPLFAKQGQIYLDFLILCFPDHIISELHLLWQI